MLFGDASALAPSLPIVQIWGALYDFRLLPVAGIFAGEPMLKFLTPEVWKHSYAVRYDIAGISVPIYY